ncbi:hypothetical protein FNF29_00143 [Cafeteria roenbergensis]|uniref:peptidylprolyl isomerase n=1 Tax=Cafeteria roenbergensis TaxID=33653 RepID=A0A5A8CYX1_CAFRO|nr:hypothetical protein FNF29_00143 [Cafeteria roenbergensis]|mmetsp:Transcript_379/g.1333  ORF Transcript_379/g.1333 Transcript_379/m.1333 type:complete len:146 (-) Transcript_379:91-528(-)|eukprot:KAA0157567.1 hypothetical protein FNF29_00143 [Cafeteria roenbergensis]
MLVRKGASLATLAWTRRALSTEAAWQDLGRGLAARDSKVGGGERVAARGSSVEVQYSALAADSGRLLECTYQSGEPLSFRVGEGMVPPGIDAGVVGMREGGIRALVLPDHLAYGRFGSPPCASLLVEVELVRVVNEDAPSAGARV